MLFFKRFITSVVLFVVLFAIVWVGVLVAGVAVVAVRAVVQVREEYHGSPPSQDELNEENRAAGRKAGGEFGRKYEGLIAWIALGVAGIAAPAIGFGGVFVWCREKRGA